MAAGFTIETEKIEALQQKIEELSDTLIDDTMLTRTLRIDCEMPLSMVKDSFYQSLQKLSPFGMGNPEPTFVTKKVLVKDRKIIGRDMRHAKFLLYQENSPILDAIAFGMAEKAKELQIGDKIDVVYTVDENIWNGNRKQQLKVKDLKASQLGN